VALRCGKPFRLDGRLGLAGGARLGNRLVFQRLFGLGLRRGPTRFVDRLFLGRADGGEICFDLGRFLRAPGRTFGRRSELRPLTGRNIVGVNVFGQQFADHAGSDFLDLAIAQRAQGEGAIRQPDQPVDLQA